MFTVKSERRFTESEKRKRGINKKRNPQVGNARSAWEGDGI